MMPVICILPESERRGRNKWRFLWCLVHFVNTITDYKITCHCNWGMCRDGVSQWLSPPIVNLEALLWHWCNSQHLSLSCFGILVILHDYMHCIAWLPTKAVYINVNSEQCLMCCKWRILIINVSMHPRKYWSFKMGPICINLKIKKKKCRCKMLILDCSLYLKQ